LHTLLTKTASSPFSASNLSNVRRSTTEMANQISKHSTNMLKQVEHFLPRIKCRNQSIRMPKPFALMQFLPNHVERLYTYSGSLTTPPCSETVTWYVIDTLLPVSEDTVSARSPNCRPSLAQSA
jgi:carbonic anhydrase